VDTDLRVTGSLELQPIFWKNPPEITVRCAGTMLYQGPLIDREIFGFDLNLSMGQHQLCIIYRNKTDQDCLPDKGLDQAVTIQNVEFFGVCDQKFLDIGKYVPNYPEPWAEQQIKQGQRLPEYIIGSRYLGWNGKWTLEFTVPIFTWMHEMMHLGHIYRASG